MALLPKPVIDTFDQKIKLLMTKIFKEKNVERKNLVDELVKDGWEKIYEDDISIIYQK